MNKSMALRRMLLAPPNLRSSFLPTRTYLSSIASPRTYAVQSVTSASFWASLIPKPLRKTSTSAAKIKKPRSKEWNPATFFIIIFMLIGSMSIQMIALRNNFAAFDRRANAKIGLLREIIERIQKGEEVDVEGLLGTGDEKKEKEWEEVLREIEEEDQAWEHSRRPKPKHGRNLEESKASEPKPPHVTQEISKVAKEKEKSNAPSGFY